MIERQSDILFMQMFTPLILERIEISINDQFKIGQLINFKFENFYVHLDIKINDRIKKYTLPFPFNIEKLDDNGILFDYRNSSFNDISDDLKKSFKHSDDKSCFYDSIVKIQKYN